MAKKITNKQSEPPNYKVLFNMTIEMLDNAIHHVLNNKNMKGKVQAINSISRAMEWSFDKYTEFKAKGY